MNAVEIERKWLVDPENIPYELSGLDSCRIEQHYITFSPAIRIRSINCGEQYIMTVKTHPDGDDSSPLAREEHEFPISAWDYEKLREEAKGVPVCKTRYFHVLPSGLKEEIDVFGGDLSGLVFLEIEFPDLASAEAYPDPDWVTRDVSDDGRYKNSSLAAQGRPSADASEEGARNQRN